MKDPRAQNLAKILVGYSTKVKEGEVVSIDGESAAEPLLAAVYEEVLKAGRPPDPQHVARGPGRRPTTSTPPTHQLDWVSPVSEWMVENADVRIAVGASHQHARALGGAAGAPDAAPDGDGRR